MGGFQINGCGARDYFTKVKYLGDSMCPVCKKTMPFYLEKGKYKVSVLWVPTVTLKERYAVMCEKCKNGKWIEDDVAQKLLNGAVNSPAATFSAEPAKGISQPSASPTVGYSTAEAGNFAANSHMASQAPDTLGICTRCGAQVSGAFCSNCGAKYVPQANSPITPQQQQKQFCPNCGAQVTGAFCGNCGTKCASNLADGNNAAIKARLVDLYEKANALMNQGNYAQELNVLNEAYGLDRNNADTLIKIGRCYRALGNSDKALEIYRQAIAIDPKSGTAYTNIGTIFLLKQNWAEAAKQYETGLQFIDKATYDHWVAQANYAVAVAKLGNIQRAEALIREAELHGYQNGNACRAMAGITT